MEVEHDVGAAVGGERDDAADELAVALAAVALVGGAAEPEVLLDGEAHAVGFPLVDGDDGRLLGLPVVRDALRARKAHALEPDFASLVVEDFWPFDMERARPLVGLRRLRRHIARGFLRAALLGFRARDGGVGRDELEVFDFVDARLDLEEAGHHGEGDGVRRHEEGDLAVAPVLLVALRVDGGRVGHALELLVVGAEELADDARVEPGLLAADKARHLLAPRKAERLHAGGNVRDAVVVEKLAGLRLLKAERGLAGQEGASVGEGLSGLFAAVGDLRGDLGGAFGGGLLGGGAKRCGVDGLKNEVVEIDRAGGDIQERGHELENARIGRHEEGDLARFPAVGVLAFVGRAGSAADLAAAPVHVLHHDAGVEPRLRTLLQPRHAPAPREAKGLGAFGDVELAVDHGRAAVGMDAREAVALLDRVVDALRRIRRAPGGGRFRSLLEVSVGDEVLRHSGESRDDCGQSHCKCSVHGVLLQKV